MKTTDRMAVLLLTSYAMLATVLAVTYALDLHALKRERDAYNWRFFTCRTLLDDPQTRAIMDVKWKRQNCWRRQEPHNVELRGAQK